MTIKVTNVGITFEAEGKLNDPTGAQVSARRAVRSVTSDEVAEAIARIRGWL